MTADEDQEVVGIVECVCHAEIDFEDSGRGYFTVTIVGDEDDGHDDQFSIGFPCDELDRKLDERGLRRVDEDWYINHRDMDIRLTERDRYPGEVVDDS